ncbi:MAG: ABC transporter permease [Alphaproteobacteria bacterium]
MAPLDRKLWRDLWRIRGQAIAIALVVASGVALLVMARTSMEALVETRDAYYERHRFADVFTSVKRAPRRLADEIAALPGVRAAETRVVELATIEVEGFDEPIVGQFVSLPERDEPRLNRLALRTGRSVEPGRVDEVVLNEPFAEAHGLAPGDRIRALLNGRQRTLTVVGIALSPEFVYSLGPGQLMPDNLRYGVLWMGEEALEAAYDMEDAFNNAVLALDRNANAKDLIARLDALLAGYGGTGAIDRTDQLSNWFLSNEIQQQRNMSSVLPTVFLAVAAFLLSLVFGRLIAAERGEIGLLKAFGYGNFAIALHYLKAVAVIAGLGIVIGATGGYFLGGFNTALYAEFYRFPELLYRPATSTFGWIALVTLGVAFAATLGAVMRAARLPPAEALRPPAPTVYRRTWLARSFAARLFDQPTRIILRQIGRFPLRSLMSALGIGMAIGVLVVAFQWRDAIARMVDVFFLEAQRQTATVGFVELTSDDALDSVKHLPGVLDVEPLRVVSTRLHHGARSHRQSIQGVPETPRLSLVLDNQSGALDLPPEGLVLSTKLAELLGAGPGDRILVEVLEGRRPTVELPVVATYDTYIGTPLYMHIDALNRLMEEPGTISGVHVLADPAQEGALYRKLRELPRVSSVTLRRAAIDGFHETMGQVVDIFIAFFVAFSCTLAVGVIYNGARIALSERGRDLATLRVLGFSRWQISYILLGELGLIALAGLPLGCAAGYGLVCLIVRLFDTELFRVPAAIEAATFGTAVAIALAATIASAALVRRRLDKLDLIEVLKTRE